MPRPTSTRTLRIGPHAVRLPDLPSLHTRPSWVNAHGRLDRSACAEITVAQARHLAGCTPWRTRDRDLPWAQRHAIMLAARAASDPAQRNSRMSAWKWRRLHQLSVRPLPGERAARSIHGRDSTGIITISASMLERLHDQRMPRRLAGDLRTARANAMRPAHPRPARSSAHRFRCRVTRQHPYAWPAAANLDINPNAGATRQKVLALPNLWRQQLRVERWRFPTRIAPAYYLICPGRSRRQRLFTGMGSAQHQRTMTVAAAPLSTCGAGRKDPRTGRCPQRCLKLLLPLCTPQEQRDADRAQAWIASLSRRLRADPRIAALVAAIVHRYGVLFQPRMLLCPRCLGVKYGNNPETVRQGWRRRHGKADVAVGGRHPIGNLFRVDAPLSAAASRMMRLHTARLQRAEARAQSSREIWLRRRLRELSARAGTPHIWRSAARVSGSTATLRELLRSIDDDNDRLRLCLLLARIDASRRYRRECERACRPYQRVIDRDAAEQRLRDEAIEVMQANRIAAAIRLIRAQDALFRQPRRSRAHRAA